MKEYPMLKNAHKKQICVYTRSGVTSPSSYYRILQYEKDINAHFHNRNVVPDVIYRRYNKTTGLKRYIYGGLYYGLSALRLFCYMIKDILVTPDIIFISRAMMPKISFAVLTKLLAILLKKCEKVIWDIDDNIFCNGELTNEEKIILLKYSDVIIVIGDYLKSLIPSSEVYKVICLPTTDGDMENEDLGALFAKRKARYDSGELCLLWLATYTSLPFLEDIIPYLDLAAKEINEKSGMNLVLEVLCNRALEVSVNKLVIRNIEWSKERAFYCMKNAHIGIMPLRNNTQTLGKGGFKLIQYMSVGLPCIGTDVGFSHEVIENQKTGILVSPCYYEDWSMAIGYLNNWDRICSMGYAGRIRWDMKFSYKTNMNIIKNLFEIDG